MGVGLSRVWPVTAPIAAGAKGALDAGGDLASVTAQEQRRETNRSKVVVTNLEKKFTKQDLWGQFEPFGVIWETGSRRTPNAAIGTLPITLHVVSPITELYGVTVKPNFLRSSQDSRGVPIPTCKGIWALPYFNSCIVARGEACFEVSPYFLWFGSIIIISTADGSYVLMYSRLTWIKTPPSGATHQILSLLKTSVVECNPGSWYPASHRWEPLLAHRKFQASSTRLDPRKTQINPLPIPRT